VINTIRTLVVVNALVDAATGIFATVAPHTFYRHVIGVDLLGPYNEHLLSDVGGFYLGFAVLFGWAAVVMTPEIVWPVCAAATLTTVLHFAFHAAHLTGFSTAQTVAQTAGLTISIAMPAAALLLTARISHAGRWHTATSTNHRRSSTSK
jgi:hypothetical protein